MGKGKSKSLKSQIFDGLLKKTKDLTFMDLAKIVLASAMLGVLIDKFSDLLGWAIVVVTIILVFWEYIEALINRGLGKDY